MPVRVVPWGHLRGPRAGTCQDRDLHALNPTWHAHAQPDEALADALPSSASQIHAPKPSRNTHDRRSRA
jgi:hypothetical protein